jgi:ABC-type phosphate/phosphonate transport system substrate-binding protein
VEAESGIQSLEDLRGRTVAVGAKDSPQATLIPLGMLHRAGLTPGEDFDVRRFDVLVGKHGDHVGGELDAYRCLAAGDASAAAMLDPNWHGWTGDGTIDPARYRILASTDRFDHCVFTVREDFSARDEERWLRVLFSMSYDNPEHRDMMDMEGLKEWLPGRVTGFGALQAATDALDYFTAPEL